MTKMLQARLKEDNLKPKHNNSTKNGQLINPEYLEENKTNNIKQDTLVGKYLNTAYKNQ